MERIKPFAFFSTPFAQFFLKGFKKNILNLKKHHSIKHMQQHGCVNMCVDLIVTFNSIKINFLLYFSAHNN